MRTYGRSGPNGVWVEIVTEPNGYNDQVYMTTLIQCLKAQLGESPFYADYGLPSEQSIMQQLFPDYYVAVLQQRFAPYFAALSITRTSDSPPTYQVNITEHNGVQFSQTVPTFAWPQ